MEELEALLILNSFPYIGSIKIRFLIEYYGSALNALKTPLHELETLPGFGPKILNAWEKGLKDEKWKEDLVLAERLEARLIPYYSTAYPKRLLEISDFPLVLYAQGNLLHSDQHCLAVVGTRQATLYGLEMARLLSRELAQAGYTIVSGLARGIDTAAHEGALENGRTIAVLGSGLASLYPRENSVLAERIKGNGALLSEFPMKAAPAKHYFPQRNRIVSGMTLGTILIEAPAKSGALLTAENALSQGRPVFALPGRADGDYFRGNHALIREGKAKLIEGVHHILQHFDRDLFSFLPKPERTFSMPLEKEEEFLLNQLTSQELSIEEIVTKIQLPVAKLNGLLMSLVLKKAVKEYPGKIYRKI